jgi:hypothetical protein
LILMGGSTFTLYKLWEQPVDKFWTPSILAQELNVVSDRVEVLVKGESLQKALTEGRITMAGPYGQDVVPLTAVTLRINNYEQVRLARVPKALTASAFLGAGVVLFFLGLFAPSLGGYMRVKGDLTELHLLHEA